MTNLAPPFQHVSCWQEDGSPRPCDPDFSDTSEELFRGFTSNDLEDVGGAMPGICFRFDPGCSVNRGRFCDWQSVARDDFRAHMGVLGVTVGLVSLAAICEQVSFGTHLRHTPRQDENNYAHTDIEIETSDSISDKKRRKIRKYWRTLLDEKLNGDGSNPGQWKRYCLREAQAKTH